MITCGRGKREKGRDGWHGGLTLTLNFFIVLIFEPCELHYLVQNNVGGGERIHTLPNLIKEEHKKKTQDQKVWMESWLFKLPGIVPIWTNLKILWRRLGKGECYITVSKNLKDVCLRRELEETGFSNLKDYSSLEDLWEWVSHLALESHTLIYVNFVWPSGPMIPWKLF